MGLFRKEPYETMTDQEFVDERSWDTSGQYGPVSSRRVPFYMPENL